MRAYDFLSHERLGERLYAVRECYLNPENRFNIYVVAGSERVAVVDTGLGVTGALRQYIEENIVRGKPMIAYMTHGDLDHLGGATLFDGAFMNRAELRKLDWNLNVERRFSDLGVFCNNNPEVLAFCKEHYIRNEGAAFRDIEDGTEIDLGGVKLLAARFPGHSAGSMAYLNYAEKYALVGDAISPYNAMQRCPDYEACLNAYVRMAGLIHEDMAIYNGHVPSPIPRRLLLDMIQALREMVNHETDGDERIGGWKFPMVDPEELAYDLRLHRAGGVVVNYNAKALRGAPEERPHEDVL